MATVEKLENNKAKLTVTIDADAFLEGIRQAYVKNGKRYNIPGFRKGKAPRKVIENMYGESVFYEDAFELIWADAYDKALAESALQAVDQPSLDIVSIDLENGIVFTAEVQLMPEVTLGKYQGIEVPEPTYTVKDTDVDAAIEREREKNARFLDVSRAAEDGDRVTIDYSGSVDGEKFDGGTAEDQTLVLGSKSFIPGFEEQVVGMNAGEEKDISVRFPDEYHAENLAGKDAIFHVALKQVQVKELPALDDEFAKDISEFDTLSELRADRKAKMTEQAENSKKNAIENEALRIACENASVEIPDVLIDRQANYMLRDMAYRLSMSGISLEDYCKYSGVTAEQLKDSTKPEAKDRVKLQLVIEAIGKTESIECSDEELEKAADAYAAENNLSAEEFKNGLTDEDREFLRDREIARKAVDTVVSTVVLTAPKAEDAENTEKKADAE